MREQEKSSAAREAERRKFQDRTDRFRDIQQTYGQPSPFGKGKWYDAIQQQKNADDVNMGREIEDRVEIDRNPNADVNADRRLATKKHFKFEPSSRDYCSPSPRVIDKRGGFVEVDPIHKNPTAGCATADQTHVRRRLGKPFSPLAAAFRRSELSNDPRTRRTRQHLAGAIQSLEGEGDTYAAGEV